MTHQRLVLRSSPSISFLSLTLALALAACGSDSGSSAATPPTDFIGTWHIASGMATLSCNGVNLPPFALQGDQMVRAGTDAPLEYVVQPSCTLKLDITGNKASVRPNQSCQITASGVSMTANISSGSFTVTAPAMASFEVMGTARNPLGGADCNLAASGMSTRTP